MNVTIFGLTLSSSWGNGHATPYRAIVRGLARMGHRVTFYEKDVPYYARHRDFDCSPDCELVLYSSWDEVRAAAMRRAAESDAVIIGSYCPEGARIAEEVLDLARPVRIFYDLDTPITLAQVRNGNIEHIRPEQMPAFDLYLSFTGGKVLRELRGTWNVARVLPLYGCVDPDVHMRVAPRAEFACDLSYMGTFAADRQAKLDALFLEPSRQLRDRRFLIAGSLYPWHWQWGENVTKLDHIAPADHPAFYSSSRLTLNITRVDMAATGFCPSGRFFEAAACGTPVISDAWVGLETFFKPGEELLLASSAADVVAAMQRSDEELARIAQRARERTLAEHTGDVRARELVRHIENLAARVRWDSKAEVA